MGGGSEGGGGAAEASDGVSCGSRGLKKRPKNRSGDAHLLIQNISHVDQMQSINTEFLVDLSSTVSSLVTTEQLDSELWDGDPPRGTRFLKSRFLFSCRNKEEAHYVLFWMMTFVEKVRELSREASSPWFGQK